MTWRQRGKTVAADASVDLAPEPADARGWQWARALATVPGDADELVIEISGELFPGDTVSASAAEVYKLDEAPDMAERAMKEAQSRKPVAPASGTRAVRPFNDDSGEIFPEDAGSASGADVDTLDEPPEAKEPVRAAAPKRKPAARLSGKRARWTFDESAKTLTDGNWTLKATFARGSARRTALVVSGEKAKGAGLLDFTGVWVDTGKRVATIGKFARNPKLTGLVGPDIESVESSAFRSCSALKSVELSPDVKLLDASCFAGCEKLVNFSPTVFKPDARLRGSAFNGCTSLAGDFSYDGTNAISGALFMGTSITSFCAPLCCSLNTRAFSECPNLQSVVFASDKTFADDAARAAFMRAERGRAGLLVNLVPKNRQPVELKAPKRISVTLSPAPSVKGVVPGELYGVGVSMRATAISGKPRFCVKWRGAGAWRPGDWHRPFTVKGPRQNGVWRRGEVLVRVPPGADELVLDAGATVNPGESFEFDKVEIFKLGDPLPAWPEEANQPKQ